MLSFLHELLAEQQFTACDVSVSGVLCLMNGRYVAGVPATSRELSLHLDFSTSEPIDMSGNAVRGFGKYGVWPAPKGTGLVGYFDQNYVVIPTQRSPDFLGSTINLGVNILNIPQQHENTEEFELNQMKLLYGRVDIDSSSVKMSPAIFFNPTTRKIIIGLSIGSELGNNQMFESNMKLAEDNSWYHIAVVFSQQNQVYLYIDGILDFVEQVAEKPGDYPDIITTIGNLPESKLKGNLSVATALTGVQVWDRVNSPNFIQAQAQGFLGNSSLGSVKLGCTDCTKQEATNICESLLNFGLCSKVGLTLHGWPFVEKYGLRSENSDIHSTEQTSSASILGSRSSVLEQTEKALGICCHTSLL